MTQLRTSTWPRLVGCGVTATAAGGVLAGVGLPGLAWALLAPVLVLLPAAGAVEDAQCAGRLGHRAGGRIVAALVGLVAAVWLALLLRGIR